MWGDDLGPEPDADLVARAKAGHDGAAAELFDRYRGLATGYAARLSGVQNADDLVAEAFTRVFARFAKGEGAEAAFRSYLLATIRNLSIDHARRGGRELLIDEFDDVQPDTGGPDEVDALLESGAISRAFARLPERWRTVLWHAEVLQEPLEQVAERMGSNPNAVAALGFRAREGLRQAYLGEHLRSATNQECRATVEAMPKFVRGSLNRARRSRLDAHISGCRQCAEALLEMEALNLRLPLLLAPAGLGVGVLHLAGFAGRLRHPVTLAAGGTATAAGVVAALVLLAAGQEPEAPAAPSALPSEPVSQPTVAVVRHPSPRPHPSLAPSTSPPPARPSPQQPASTSSTATPTAPPTPTSTPTQVAALGSPRVSTASTSTIHLVNLIIPATDVTADETIEVRLTNAVAAQKPDGGGWSCAVASPGPGSVSVHCTRHSAVRLADVAMAFTVSDPSHPVVGHVALSSAGHLVATRGFNVAS